MASTGDDRISAQDQTKAMDDLKVDNVSCKTMRILALPSGTCGWASYALASGALLAKFASITIHLDKY